MCIILYYILNAFGKHSELHDGSYIAYSRWSTMQIYVRVYASRMRERLIHGAAEEEEDTRVG